MAEAKKNVYLTFHKNFARTDIEYNDPETGEARTFNSVTLPKGTVIDGKDVSYYQFSPLFVNPSKYRGENYVDVPMLADREIWLKRSVLDEDGQPVIGDDGKPERDIVKVMPAQLKEVLEASRNAYLAKQAEKDRVPEKAKPLGERAAAAREGSQALAGDDIPFDAKAR